MTVLSWVLNREVAKCSDFSKECTASIFRMGSVSLKMQSVAVKTSKCNNVALQTAVCTVGQAAI
jgi:hypothetical protein